MKSAFMGVATTIAASFTIREVTDFIEKTQEAHRNAVALNRAFSQIAGSNTGAAKEFEFLRDVSDQLGQNFWTLADAYKNVAASSKGTALEGKNTRDIFIGVSQAATVLGLSADETKGALNAIAQMMSKGKVQAEELRGQLGERLPGAFNLAAKAMGVTTAQLNKMLDDGQVLAEDLLPKLGKVLQQEYGEAAKKASTDSAAAARKFDEALQDLITTIGDRLSPMMDALMNKSAKFLREITDAVKGGVEAVDVKVLQGQVEIIDDSLERLRKAKDLASGAGSDNRDSQLLSR